MSTGSHRDPGSKGDSGGDTEKREACAPEAGTRVAGEPFAVVDESGAAEVLLAVFVVMLALALTAYYLIA